jgi:hypothetical protein
MSNSRESHPPSAFLDPQWDDVLEMNVTAPQISQGWRAALSAAVAPSAPLEVTNTDARDVVSSVRRGALFCRPTCRSHLTSLHDRQEALAYPTSAHRSMLVNALNGLTQRYQINR